MRKTVSHESVLFHLGLSGDDLQKLTAYLELVERWNARTNLTGAKTIEDRARILIAGVLSGRAYVGSGELIDIGSGNGSPGIVMTVLCRPRHATLIEPRTHRWAFLREVVRVLALRDVDVLRVKYEEYVGNPADTVTVRGLSIPADRLDKLVVKGGRLLAFGPSITASSGKVFLVTETIGDLSIWERFS